MDAHYSTCKQAADCIEGQIIVKSDHQRANGPLWCLKLGRQRSIRLCPI
jgi:hypothetical protein